MQSSTCGTSEVAVAASMMLSNQHRGSTQDCLLGLAPLSICPQMGVGIVSAGTCPHLGGPCTLHIRGSNLLPNLQHISLRPQGAMQCTAGGGSVRILSMGYVPAGEIYCARFSLPGAVWWLQLEAMYCYYYFIFLHEFLSYSMWYYFNKNLS